MEDEQEFQGFVPPVSNYFRMPNEWINICAEITSLAELKVVQYVLRHTWGFHEYDGKTKTITTDEFMYGRKYKDGSRMDRGTGLSDRGVKDGIALAVGNKYLVCEVDDRDKARIKKSYKLNILSENSDGKNLPTKELELGRKNSPISDGKNLPISRKNSPIDKEDSSHRSVKGTQEKHPKKNIGKESTRPDVPEEPTIPNASPTDMPSSSLLESLNEVERAFWELWCNRPCFKIRPKLTEIALGHVRELAPHITTSEQLERLVEYSRQKLLKRNIKDAVKLGNMSGDLNDWLQTQTSTSQGKAVKPLDAMSKDELIAHAMSFPTRMDHHTQEYKDLQNCLNRLNPDDKAQAVRKRMDMQNQKVDPLVLSTPYNLPESDPRRSDLQNRLAYMSEQDRSEMIRQRSEHCPMEFANTMVLWTRQPGHNGTAIKNWRLYEKMSLKEAIAYEYEANDLLRAETHDQIEELLEAAKERLSEMQAV